jgi:pyridoxal phosphate enzyme (YggS family)
LSFSALIKSEMMMETATATLAERIEQARSSIRACALRCNRLPEEITLVAVSKTHPAKAVREAISAGLTDFGENRVQEAEAKIPVIGRNAARWHLIGHLQSNKARKAVELFDVIHSLDSIALARRLDHVCAELNRERLPVLIQVDLGHEATKTGLEESGLRGLVEAIGECQRLRLSGLMTLPPFFDDAERVRPYFRRLRELRDGLRAKGAFGDRAGDLSMGMTHDYQIAIEEGATIVRVGTAIFGERGSSPTLRDGAHSNI